MRVQMWSEAGMCAWVLEPACCPVDSRAVRPLDPGRPTTRPRPSGHSTQGLYDMYTSCPAASSSGSAVSPFLANVILASTFSPGRVRSTSTTKPLGGSRHTPCAVDREQR